MTERIVKALLAIVLIGGAGVAYGLYLGSSDPHPQRTYSRVGRGDADMNEALELMMKCCSDNLACEMRAAMQSKRQGI